MVESKLTEAPISSQPPSSDISEDIIRFLVSWSWRDVSVIIRFNLDPIEGLPVDVDIKVIDYELKEAGKLRSTPKKDAKFLRNYLEHALRLA